MLQRAANLFLGVIFLMSCKQHNDNAEINMLIQGFVNANEHIELSNLRLYTEFEQKSADPVFASYSLKWFPKSQKIKEYTSEMIRDIDILLERNALRAESAQHDLYIKLLHYKRNLVNVLDPAEYVEIPALSQQLIKARRSLYSEIPVLAFADDTTGSFSDSTVEKHLLDSLFNNSNPLMQKAVLYKIKNDVLISEYKLLYYCLALTSGLAVHYDEYGAIAALNSSYFKAGDTIELSAGMARFSGESSPRITVNDKEIKLKGFGHTNHFLRATGKPGKYNLKVNFEYFRADGVKESVTKNLSYTILP